MANGVAYITIQQFCTFHRCETVIIEEFIEHGLIKVQRQNDVVVIPEPEVPRIEKALRLYHELGVNTPGIDIILNLLDRLEGHRRIEDF